MKYDVITNKRLILKRFEFFVCDVPERWKRDYSHGEVDTGYYPNSLIKRYKDVIILDLEKINVIIHHRFSHRIIFLEQYKITYDDGSVADFSKFIARFFDPYSKFISIKFSRKDPSWMKVLEILCNNFNFYKKYEDSYYAMTEKFMLKKIWINE
ncbi:MAG: hypothetical protein ACTSRP_11195 [Candidatus Helarchaeota archaeon]